MLRGFTPNHVGLTGAETCEEQGPATHHAPLATARERCEAACAALGWTAVTFSVQHGPWRVRAQGTVGGRQVRTRAFSCWTNLAEALEGQAAVRSRQHRS